MLDYMMRVICLFFCFSMSVLLSGCTDNFKVNVSLGQVREVGIVLDTVMLRELIVPSGIIAVGKDVVVVNSARDNADVLFRYDGDLHFAGSFFAYGRAANEFVTVSGSPLQRKDSTLSLNTNLFDCTEFIVSDSEIRIGQKIRIVDEVRNNIIVLNDSLAVYRTRLEEYPYCIYNYRTQEVVSGFGDYPKSPIKYSNRNDRDNVCLSNMVYSESGNRLLAFYESLPLIRVYDATTYGPVKEITIDDALPQSSSLDGFYDWQSVIYFQNPVSASDRVYVSYINSSVPEDVPDGMVLLAMDCDGTVICKYTLDRFCGMYSVSDDGVFYGICTENGEYVLCRAVLY